MVPEEWRMLGLMTVVPADPSYQGQWYQGQLRSVKRSIAFKIAMRPFHQDCIY